MPTTLATLAWIASLSQDGCDYARVEGAVVQDLAFISDAPWIEVGMSAYRIPQYETTEEKWFIDYKEDCIGYGSYSVGFAFEAARIFSFLALVFGGGGALFLWFSSCFVFGPSTWKWAGYEVAAAVFFQLLAFSWYGSNLCKNGNSCSPHYGSNSDIIALIFWSCAAVLIFRKYPTPVPKEGEEVDNVNVGDLELPMEGQSNVARMELANDPGTQKNVKATEDDAEII